MQIAQFQNSQSMDDFDVPIPEPSWFLLLFLLLVEKRLLLSCYLIYSISRSTTIIVKEVTGMPYIWYT